MSGFVTPIRSPFPTPTDQKPDKDKKSGDALLTYRFGAGYLAAPNDYVPAAFKSLGDLVVYWRITGKGYLGGSTVYALKGVSPNTGICIAFEGHGPGNNMWLLYTAPWAAHNAWYYLNHFLKVAPGINTGPVVEGLKAASHVLIVRNKGHIGDLSAHTFLRNYVQVSSVVVMAGDADFKKLTAL